MQDFVENLDSLFIYDILFLKLNMAKFMDISEQLIASIETMISNY